MVEYSGNQAAIDDLCALVNNEDVFCLLGAGASVPALPTWNCLLHDLLLRGSMEDHISEADAREYKLMATEDPLQLAAALERAFTRPIFRAMLGDIFSAPKQKTTLASQKVVALQPSGVITLNYDNCLEEAFAAATGQAPKSLRISDAGQSSRWLQRSRSPKDFAVLHLHGVASDPENMIFTGPDYLNFYSNAENLRVIEDAWQTRHLLVIGFGFSDPFFTQVAYRAVGLQQSDIRHFAFVGRDENSPISHIQRQQFAEKFRLKPIFYETKDAGRDHSQLGILLEQITLTRQPKEQPPKPTTPVSMKTVDDNEFEQSLLYGPRGVPLYVEPRLSYREKLVGADNEGVPFTIPEIVLATTSYYIECPKEFGGTTLAKRLKRDIENDGKSCMLRDATQLPKYKAKLDDEFTSASNAVLVLDGFDQDRDGRLLKELIGLKRFSRLIICSSTSSHAASTSLPIEALGPNTRIAVLSHLTRADIRSLASALFDTSDTDLASEVTAKVYDDLLTLCIPLTPANVIMYLRILHKEGDFTPINRVQLMERYIQEVLRGPSDLYRQSFNSKNKIDVLSGFAHNRYTIGSASFEESDWNVFCRDLQRRTLVDFDETRLFNELLRCRIFLRIGKLVVFKYRFFFSFLVGRHVAIRPELLSRLLDDESYLNVSGLVEAISGCSADNSLLAERLSENLSKCLSEFQTNYIPLSFDPMGRMAWPQSEGEDDKLWKPLSESIAEGPAKPAEVDALKTSILAERRTTNQQVAFERYDRLERRLVAVQIALSEVLRNSDELDAAIKMRGIRLVLNAYAAWYQLGLVLAEQIAEKRYVFWFGILFHHEMEDVADDHRAVQIALAMPRAVGEKVVETLGTAKLGEVFKALSRDKDDGFFRYQIYRALIRAKPKAWDKVCEDILKNVKKNELYLRYFLFATLAEFKMEVNTARERDDLRRLIALIKAKRDLGKDQPGSKLISRVLSRLDEVDYFNAQEAARSKDEK